MKLADRIRKHAEAHPNIKETTRDCSKLDAIRAELKNESTSTRLLSGQRNTIYLADDRMEAKW